MLLHATPRLAAEVPGFSQEQLDGLARSVEARRQQLEEDIRAYVARKQDELRQYEIELVDERRSMERDDDAEAASRAEGIASPSLPQPPAQSQPQPQSPPSQSQPLPSPDEQKKQKKHGRVHKREKELYGLVTPVFLPLLDACESTSPTKQEKEKAKAKAAAKQAKGAGPSTAPSIPGAARDAESSTAGRTPQKATTDAGAAMPGDTAVKERSASDPGKKSRRSSIKKKSALRHSSTPRNRKRVSLVIDDQVVLPSDVIQEPALTSPSSETTSATNSTTSLDDMIDPRLTSPDAPVYIEHHHAVHHSLPLTMTQPKTSPVKASAPPFSNPTPVVSEAAHSPPTSPGVKSPAAAYAPPSYATRSFLDPPPERMHIEDIPTTAGPDPIYPSNAEDTDLPSPARARAADENFSTYVGGISGSGVDDVNQVGSVGYPSSLGASYLESYMQGRPLSVRMAAAQREGDEDEVKRLRGLEERRRRRDDDERRAKERERVDDEDWGNDKRKGGTADDEDDFMGSMDDF